MARAIQKFSVKESVNLSLKRVIKVQPTFTADDNDDNHVAFGWTEIPGAFSGQGVAATLNSIFVLNGMNRQDVIELVFCGGSSDSGTAPTVAQILGVGSAVVDITQAETQEVGICGHVNIVAGDYVEGNLLTAVMAQKTGIGLVMSPKADSTSLYVGGIWRYDPADNTSLGTNLMDIYFGCEG